MSTSDNSTLQNYQLYTLLSLGTAPVLLSEMKGYMGVTSATSDAIIQALLDTCIAWGQSYTGREFTSNSYSLNIDCFEDRISLRRNPINTITTVKYLLSDVLTTVASSVYTLKKGRVLSEILLKDAQTWPVDGDEVEQGIEIIFVCQAIDVQKLSIAESAIKRHVAYMFENRGDCGDCGSCSGSDKADVESLYNFFRIARI